MVVAMVGVGKVRMRVSQWRVAMRVPMPGAWRCGIVVPVLVMLVMQVLVIV